MSEVEIMDVLVAHHRAKKITEFLRETKKSSLGDPKIDKEVEATFKRATNPKTVQTTLINPEYLAVTCDALVFVIGRSNSLINLSYLCRKYEMNLQKWKEEHKKRIQLYVESWHQSRDVLFQKGDHGDVYGPVLIARDIANSISKEKGDLFRQVLLFLSR